MSNCSNKTIKNSVITGTIGWGIFGLGILMLLIFAIFRFFDFLVITDLMFWCALLSVVIGGIIGIVGSGINDGCKGEMERPQTFM